MLDIEVSAMSNQGAYSAARAASSSKILVLASYSQIVFSTFCLISSSSISTFYPFTRTSFGFS